MTIKWRITVLGDGGAGKTALAVQFCMNAFVETYDPTIEDSFRRQVVDGGVLTWVEVIDTAGQEEYSTLRDQWIREAKGFVLVYSVTSRRSFERLPIFYNAIKRNRREANPIIILVGNKSDKQNEREISKEEGLAKAKELGIPFIETSAKTASNVDRAFGDVLRMVIERYEGSQGAGGGSGAPGGSGSSAPPQKRKKKTTCIIA